MFSYRYFIGLVLASICVVPGCSNLIGLNDYSAAGQGGELGESGESGARARNEAGRSGTAAGGNLGQGGNSATGGSAGGSIGDAGNGGDVSVGGLGNAGAAGAASDECSDDCNDDNECTDDTCVSAKCVHRPALAGASCGSDLSCDGAGVCVRCQDTAAGDERDQGCPASAPVCIGTGKDAVCGGCTSDADCNDANDCTSEACVDSKCVITAVNAGEDCSNGVCNGAAPEKCVTCIDDAKGAEVDSGCSHAKPVCDTSATPTCYECVKDTDCASDNVSCTVETCSNHVCTHVATDSQCSGTDACHPGKCDANTGCTTVSISPLTQTLISATKNNGSFETFDTDSAGDPHPATGWKEDGPYWLTRDCTDAQCKGSNSSPTYASAGKALAWFGGVTDAAIGDLNRVISLPVGAISLHVQADTNFQTASTAASNKDLFQVRLMDSAYEQIGQPLFAQSAADAQTGTTHMWTSNGIDVMSDVSALAGQSVSLSFWSSSDTKQISDFFIDNVRVSVTYCQ